MENNSIRHEIVSSNPDIDVRFYLSEDSGGYVAPHWHNSLELVYMIEGSMVTQFENNVRQTLHPGEFSIVNPRVIHSVTAQKNKALVLLIPSAVLEKYIPAYDLLEFHVDMHPEHPVDVTRLERIKKIFTDMYIVYDVRPDAYLLKFNSLLYDLLYTLVHSYSIRLTDKAVNKRNRSINKVKNIMRYIEDHHSEKIVMEDIAAHFGYNPDCMRYACTKLSGICRKRITVSERFLKITAAPIISTPCSCSRSAITVRQRKNAGSFGNKTARNRGLSWLDTAMPKIGYLWANLHKYRICPILLSEYRLFCCRDIGYNRDNKNTKGGNLPWLPLQKQKSAFGNVFPMAAEIWAVTSSTPQCPHSCSFIIPIMFTSVPLPSVPSCCCRECSTASPTLSWALS